jgi:RES domain-containing protein
MFVYRVTHPKYKDSVLSGVGAEKVGGRWNVPGTRAVYCSQNVALALLEYYVHASSMTYLPKEILVAQIEFPDDLKIEEVDQLPERWNQYPYSSKTSSVFTNLANDRDFFALKVPSTLVPLEYNYILNPLFKDFGRVEVRDFLALPVDQRLRR